MQIAIPVYDGFTALDAIGPYEVLCRIPSSELAFVGAETREYRTDTGRLGLMADRTFAEWPRPDLIVVPGGPMNWDPMTHGALVAWLRAAHPHTTWTTSVCTGALLMAAAGVLEGLSATTHWAARDTLASMGATVVDARVVIEEQARVMTAAGVSAGIDMALTLLARLKSERIAQAVQLTLEYDPQPPFDSGHPRTAPAEVTAAVLARLENA